jgi:UPF0755 protein
MNKKSVGRGVVLTFCIVFPVSCVLAWLLYFTVFSPAFDIKHDVDIFIDERTDFPVLISKLRTDARIKNINVFRFVASAMQLNDGKLKTGRYAVSPAMSFVSAVRMFRNGQQTPVKITFNNIRLKTDFAERIGEQLMFSPESLLDALNNNDTSSLNGLDTATVLTLFIPNTYEMYWNITVEKFIDRMRREHERFWNGRRLDSAGKIQLSPVEVSILASIVEEETAIKSDYPVIAGLYINRLRCGMPLQADPTVKFAVGDFSLRRILYTHLKTESPYNTYKYSGLPPGPIRIPSIAAIDAVLNYTHHNYLYMVAKDDLSGKTSFAATLVEHNRNARKYREALNRKSIR